MYEKWWQSSVVYQIYPKSFYDSNNDGVGDIQGIIDKLDYIKKLGVDVIWLNPMYKSPQVDNGYDISDYKDIDPIYGNLKDFEELIEKCRKIKIKIIMDLVVNHTSSKHYWFQEALKSKNNPYHDYYIWRDQANTLLSNFGGSAWEYVPHLDQYYLHFYAKDQPDLNWENEKMRKDIYNMLNYWIDKGIAGFRMDVIDLIGKKPDLMIKENGPLLHEYLQEMAKCTFKDKELLTVGETWGATIENAKLYCSPERNELNMIFQFEQINLDKIPGKQRWDLKELELIELKRVMSKWQTELDEEGWNSLFWNNHDLPRVVSRWGNDKEHREACAKMFAILLHGMKGTPYIYQGEEIGMTNLDSCHFEDYPDIETQSIIKERIEKGYKKEDILKSIQKKARDNGRTPMQWDVSDHAGFTKGIPWMKVNPNYKDINVDSELSNKNSIFYMYQELIQLRKDNIVIRQGKYELLDEDNQSVYVYKRVLHNEELVILCNFYEEELDYPLRLKEFETLISNYPCIDYQNGFFHLKPFEAMILKIKN